MLSPGTRPPSLNTRFKLYYPVFSVLDPRNGYPPPSSLCGGNRRGTGPGTHLGWGEALPGRVACWIRTRIPLFGRIARNWNRVWDRSNKAAPPGPSPRLALVPSQCHAAKRPHDPVGAQGLLSRLGEQAHHQHRKQCNGYGFGIGPWLGWGINSLLARSPHDSPSTGGKSPCA